MTVSLRVYNNSNYSNRVWISMSSGESRRQEVTEQMWHAAEDCSRSAQQRLEMLGRCRLGNHSVVVFSRCFKLFGSAECQKLLSQLHQLFTSAVDDVSEFCRSNSWLSDVWRYCSTWNQSLLAQLKGAPVSVIKVRLITWSFRCILCFSFY